MRKLMKFMFDYAVLYLSCAHLRNFNRCNPLSPKILFKDNALFIWIEQQISCKNRHTLTHTQWWARRSGETETCAMAHCTFTYLLNTLPYCHSMFHFLSRNKFHHQYFPRDMFISECTFITTTKRRTNEGTYTFEHNYVSIGIIPFLVFLFARVCVCVPSRFHSFFFLFRSVCSLCCFTMHRHAHTRTQSGVVHAHSLNPNDFIATCNKCAHMVNGVVYCVVLPMRNVHLSLKELNLIIFVGEGWRMIGCLKSKIPYTMYSILVQVHCIHKSQEYCALNPMNAIFKCFGKFCRTSQSKFVSFAMETKVAYSMAKFKRMFIFQILSLHW